MKKRAISLVLAAFLLMSLTVPALAAEEKTSTVSVTTLIEPVYEDADGFNEGLAAVKKDGKWGYIDETGSVVIDFKYDYAGSFSDGLAVVARYEVGGPNDSEGYFCYIVNAAGAETPVMAHGDSEDWQVSLWTIDGIDPIFFHDGVVVISGNAYGTDGKQIVPNREDLRALAEKCANAGLEGFGYLVESDYFSCSCANVCVDGLIPMYLNGDEDWVCFLMDKTGHVVRDFSDKVTEDWGNDNVVFLNGILAPVDGYMLAAASTMVPGTLGEFNTLFGIMDYATGRWVVQPKYSGYRYNLSGKFFLDGLWIVRSGFLYGAVDKTGREVIPMEYSYLDVYNHGLAAASQNGEWFYLDTYGNRYEVGLPGGGTAKSLAVAGSFGDNGVAPVYDADSGKAYLISATPVNGVLPAIEGSDGISVSTYFPGFDGTAASIDVTLQPDDIVTFEKDGKYGFYRLTFDLVGQNPFSDVLPGDYYFDEVVWAANEDIVDTSAGEFQPRSDCPRWQVVDFLWRAAGCPEPTLSESPFTDVTPADSFYKAVLWAYENNIANGVGDNQFNPYGTVKRCEALTFLYRAAGKPETAPGNGFVDVADDAYYIDAVAWAVGQSNPIANGVGENKFAPENPVVKCDTVVLLYRTVVENGIDVTVGNA